MRPPGSRSVAAVTALLVSVSCHTAMLRLERTGSAGIADASNVEHLRFFDGRYIPLPAAPFANCFDLLRTELRANTCDQTLPGTGYRGYALNLVPRRGTGTPPWWLRDNRPSDLFEQIKDIRVAYPDAPQAPAPETLGTVEQVPGKDDSSVGPEDARTPRVTLATEYTLAPEGVTAGDLVWLTNPGDDGRKEPWVYAGAVAKTTGRMRVLIPAPDTEVKEHWDTFTVERSLPRSVLSFIHASDAQIREPAAKLGGQLVSDTLDPLIPTFAHDYEQELFSAFFYEAIIRTVNHERAAALEDRLAGAERGDIYERCKDGGDRDCALEEELALLLARHYRVPPELMIHTGDAVDAGLLSEFEEFRSRSDLLTIPWFSVVGNHDVLGIGNLALEAEDQAWKEQRQVPDDTNVACTPVTRMLLEYYLERPTKNGEQGEQEALDRLRKKDEFSFAPIALRSVCLSLDVTDTRGVISDRFVGDRRRGDDPPSASASSRFVEAHCRNRRDWRVGKPLDDCARHLRPAGGDCGFDGDQPNYPPRHDAGNPTDEPREGAEHARNAEHRCSVLNGFDTVAPVPSVRDPNGEWPGYYAFPIKDVELDGKPPRPLWIVAINTTSPKGAYGAVSPAQLIWLTNTLGDIHAHNGLAMVFAHHQIWGIENEAEQRDLKKALFEHGNVIGYFAGHTHEPQLRAIEEDCKKPAKKGDPWVVETDAALRCGSTARRMWEIVGPSTLEFPQQARQVTLVDVPGSGGLAYFEILPFSPQLSGDGRSYVERAQASAKRDQCAGKSSCIEGEPRQPEQYLSYPRLWFRVPDYDETKARRP